MITPLTVSTGCMRAGACARHGALTLVRSSALSIDIVALRIHTRWQCTWQLGRTSATTRAGGSLSARRVVVAASARARVITWRPAGATAPRGRSQSGAGGRVFSGCDPGPDHCDILLPHRQQVFSRFSGAERVHLSKCSVILVPWPYWIT